MKLKSNLHTHTTFSDGNGSMEDTVLAAISKGFVSLGISDHAHDDIYDLSMRLDQVEAYMLEYRRLKNKYRDRIQLYLGIELDALSEQPTDGFDYVIGSVHYLLDDNGDTQYCVDYLPEMVEHGIQGIGGGDVRRFVAYYYDTLCSMAEERKPDVIGHMDLITKLNGSSRFFDEDSGWYRDLCAGAAARIAGTGCIVEVNTALAKQPGRDSFYPSPFILERLLKEGAAVTVSSDCHSLDMLDFRFDEAVALLRRCGFRSVKRLQDNGFIDIEI